MSVQDEWVTALVTYCDANLDLAGGVILGDEYGYQHLPLCVIDAVFSIGVRYTSTQNVVRRYCEHVGIDLTYHEAGIPAAEQHSIRSLLQLYDAYGVERMADQVFQNRQRTSTRSGILKAEAVRWFALALQEHQCDNLDDIDRVVGIEEFESRIRSIPGQSSGISLRYFYMRFNGNPWGLPVRRVM